WPLPSMAPLAHTLALLAMTVATAAIKVRPLDMAWDSFDDQYLNCGPAMTEALPALNRSEFQQNALFARVWSKATAECKTLKSCKSSPLPPAQAIALMAYTMNDLYKDFNKAVRKAGSSPQHYRDNFHYKTLHFLLTQALATLRVTQGKKCHSVFRAVSDVHFQARRGDIVRFGQFASTTLSKEVACEFGTDTVFQVKTCHGANIQKFSYIPGEEEVLVPPFETFKVISVTQDRECTRIQLRSNGTHSNYNCEWLGGDITEGTTWG
ncbi:NARE ribosyltransferase, partial [Erpornis zantholeuca]|nr:NARE ribosyltransferase [Erpornis zantholeuca]